jgi:hypothetical protein
MIVPPRPSHAAGIDVVRNDVVVIRELSLAESANAVLGGDLSVHQLAHFRIGADLPISAWMMGIVDATDSHLLPSSILWYRFPAAAELRAVNWAQLISTESHGFLQFGFRELTLIALINVSRQKRSDLMGFSASTSPECAN